MNFSSQEPQRKAAAVERDTVHFTADPLACSGSAMSEEPPAGRALATEPERGSSGSTAGQSCRHLAGWAARRLFPNRPFFTGSSLGLRPRQSTAQASAAPVADAAAKSTNAKGASAYAAKGTADATADCSTADPEPAAATRVPRPSGAAIMRTLERAGLRLRAAAGAIRRRLVDRMAAKAAAREAARAVDAAATAAARATKLASLQQARRHATRASASAVSLQSCAQCTCSAI